MTPLAMSAIRRSAICRLTAAGLILGCGCRPESLVAIHYHEAPAQDLVLYPPAIGRSNPAPVASPATQPVTTDPGLTVRQNARRLADDLIRRTFGESP